MTSADKLAQMRLDREGLNLGSHRALNTLTVAAAVLLAVMIWAFTSDGGMVTPTSGWFFNDSQASETKMGLVKHGQGKILSTDEDVPEEAKPAKTKEETEDEASGPATAPGDSGSDSGSGD